MERWAYFMKQTHTHTKYTLIKTIKITHLHFHLSTVARALHWCSPSLCFGHHFTLLISEWDEWWQQPTKKNQTKKSQFDRSKNKWNENCQSTNDASENEFFESNHVFFYPRQFFLQTKQRRNLEGTYVIKTKVFMINQKEKRSREEKKNTKFTYFYTWNSEEEPNTVKIVYNSWK